jgi:hypothetical protein
MHLFNHLRSLLRFTRTLKGSIALGMISVLLVMGMAMGKATAQKPGVPISKTAAAQIQALVQEKRSRTPIQQKINSSILYTLKARRGDALIRSVSALNTFVRVNSNNNIQVVVKTNVQVTPALLQNIQATGAKIVSAPLGYGRIVAQVPLAQVENIASFPEVISIRPFLKPQLHSSTTAAGVEALTVHAPSQTSQAVSNVEQKRSHLASALPHMVQQLAQAPTVPITNVGRVTSEGYKAHGADIASSSYNLNGTGVKIGVLSDSYNNLGGAATDIARGDLPAEGVTLVGSGDIKNTSPSFPGSDEGRAMLQIIHDLVPGAKLYFATAFNSEADFANNIHELQKAGCDIIVDDVYYFAEPVFQDGIVAQAVNEVTAKGALYFSSAGNSGNKNDGTSGVWEGDFADAGQAPLGIPGNIHRFASGSSGMYDRLTANTGTITLQWSDPYGKSANDYDLYVLNSSGTQVVAASTDGQNGNGDPFEVVNAQSSGGQVIIVKFSGEPRYLHLNTNRGRLAINTRGQTWGHSAAVNAFSVAAVNVATAKGSRFTGGAANPVETFSSDGPRRIFYTADGKPINTTAPNNFLRTGGVVRQKPDIAAADGVKTTFPPSSGLNPFFGTSAAAPHAAAVAALLKSYRPSLTPTQLRSILTSQALDIEAKGVDQDSGYGIVMANRTLERARRISAIKIWWHRRQLQPTG